MTATTKTPNTRNLRVYWENGAKWPPERETAAILERRQQEERGAA